MTTSKKSAEPTQEVIGHRQRLRDKLEIQPYLSKRRVIQLQSGAHCELYEHSKSAPLIIFLPGIGTYCELYAELLCKLSRRGFNVIGLDYPGHGYSSGRRGHFTVEQVTDLVSETIDFFSEQYDGPCALYGYSIGALLGVSAAEKDSRIKAVMCGTLLLPEIGPDILHSLSWQWTWSSSLFFPSLRVPMRMFIDYEQLLSGHPAGESINKDPLIVFDYPLKTLASLFTRRCKIVSERHPFHLAVLHGDCDEVLPLAYTERVLGQIAQPADLFVMKNAGHMVPWLQPDRSLDTISNWFKAHLT